MERDDLQEAARGVRWNYLASGSILLVQVLYTALTARLLSPGQFGDYAAAQALFGFVAYFGLATLGNGLIRHPTKDRAATGSAILLALAAGLLSAVAIVAVAAAWGHAWGAPGSVAPSRAFALVVLFTSLGVVPLALLRRRLGYRQAATAEAAGAFGGMVVGVILAIALAEPIALVLGQGMGAAFTALLAAGFARDELTLTSSRQEARTLLGFASHVSGQSLLYYAIYTLPSFVISRAFGTVALGIYSRANTLVTLPTTHLWMGVTKAIYPLVARARHDPGRLRDLVEGTLLSTIGLFWPLFAAVGGAGPVVVAVLLGPDFTEVSTLLPPILTFGALNLAYVTAGNALEVLGMQRLIWSYQAVWVTLLGLAIAGALLMDTDVTGLLWLVASAQLIIHLLKLRATDRVGLLRFQVVLRGYGRTLLMAAVFGLVMISAEAATSDWAIGLRCAIVLAVMLTLTTAVSIGLPRSEFARGVASSLGLLSRRLRAS